MDLNSVGEIVLIGLDALEVRNFRKPRLKLLVLLGTQNLVLDPNCRSWAISSEWIAGLSVWKKAGLLMLRNPSQRTPISIGLQIVCPDECVKSNALCYGPYTEQDVFNIHSGCIFEAKLEFMLLLFWKFRSRNFWGRPRVESTHRGGLQACTDKKLLRHSRYFPLSPCISILNKRST